MEAAIKTSYFLVPLHLVSSWYL